jgi:hypothetical protein
MAMIQIRTEIEGRCDAMGRIMEETGATSGQLVELRCGAKVLMFR